MTAPTVSWDRFSPNGYEVSSRGDRRFSAFFARLRDGRTIEEAYQLDVKGFRSQTNDPRVPKGKAPLNGKTYRDLWPEYLGLWQQWAKENPELIEELRTASAGKVLTDCFATSPVSQARALAFILNGRS